MRIIGEKISRYDIREGDVLIIEVKSGNRDRGNGEFIMKVLNVYGRGLGARVKSISFNTDKEGHIEPDPADWSLEYHGITRITLLDEENK